MTSRIDMMLVNLILLLLVIMNLVKSKNVYQFSFTAVDTANHGDDPSYCTYDYQSATYTFEPGVIICF